ncbi:MAG: response regulator transcription factor [Clostridiales bacterium]|nr:response regulator transcription factor [Clostridiales bacterium]
MRVAICDDEKFFYIELNKYLNKYSTERKVDIVNFYFSNGHDLLASNLNFDLIFMDYKMKGLNGIETAKLLRAKNKYVTIIFLTGFPEMVFQSFHVNTFRFLTKPIQESKLFNALDDFLKTIDEDSLLTLKIHDGILRIQLSELIYAESQGKHTLLRTTEGHYDCLRYLREIENMLPENKFFRCHRSFIVNFEHIKKHDNQNIYFENGEIAKIGRTQLSSFKDGFQNYILRYNEKDW